MAEGLTPVVNYHPNYLEGIDLFNRQHFFDSHEVWEALWKTCVEPERQFLKGLIQSAVALHHLQRQNLHGAMKLLASSQQYLRPYRPAYWGLNVDGFLAAMRKCFAEAVDGNGAIALSEESDVPVIRLERMSSG